MVQYEGKRIKFHVCTKRLPSYTKSIHIPAQLLQYIKNHASSHLLTNFWGSTHQSFILEKRKIEFHVEEV
jgi:hypothetical protein